MPEMKFMRSVWIALLEWMALACAIISGTVYFLNHKIAPFPIILMWIALVSGAIAVKLKLLNHHWTIRAANWICWPSIFIATALCLYLADFEVKNPMPGPEPNPQPTPVPKPHLELGLSIAGARGWPLMLTNEVFKLPFKGNGLPISEGDFKGIVVFPVPFGTSNTSVEFVLNNDSAADVLDGAVKFSIPTNAPIRVDPRWLKSRLEDDPSHLYFGSMLSRIPPGPFVSLPIIEFGTHGPSTIPIWFLATAKDMQVVVLGLQLHFFEMELPGKPFVTLAKRMTNADGTLSWSLEEHFEKQTNSAGQPIWQGENR
jgi:hypothetical protein